MMRAKLFILLVLSSLTCLAQGNKPYKAAEIITKQTYLYGKVEFRMRAAKASGVISNFFFYKQGSEQPGAFWEEIDVEVFGKNGANSWQSNLITGPAPQTRNEGVHNQSGLADSYHTYTVEWKPNSVEWYVDGVKVRGQNQDTKNQARLLTNKQSLRFNFWNPTIPEWVGPFNGNVLPLQMFVNWVKFYPWQNGNFANSPSWTDNFNSFDTNRWTKANFTFGENGSDFVPQNAVVKNGYLVLAMTRAGQTGYNGTPPVDGGSNNGGTTGSNNGGDAGNNNGGNTGGNNNGVNSVNFSSSNSKNQPAGKTWTMKVDYSATGEKDIVGSIWEGNSWKGGGRLQVSAGSGTKDIIINSSTNLPAGGNYKFTALITSRGGNWQSPGVVFGPEFTGVTLTNGGGSSGGNNGGDSNGDSSSGGNTSGGTNGGNNSDTFFVINRQTGKKLAPQNGNDGAQLIQLDASNNSNIAKWTRVNSSGGYFYLKNVSTGKYFRPATNNDGSILEQRPTSYAGNYTQWKQVNSSGGYFYLQNRQTNLYFRPNGDGNNSTMVQRPTSYAGNYTQWKFQGVSAKSLNGVDSTGVSVYPNPTSGTVNIDADSLSSVVLCDVSGRNISNYENVSSIDISSLGAGVYFLKLSINGGATITKQIIKK